MSVNPEALEFMTNAAIVVFFCACIVAAVFGEWK